jgi:hypothetical protein
MAKRFSADGTPPTQRSLAFHPTTSSPTTASKASTPPPPPDIFQKCNLVSSSRREFGRRTLVVVGMQEETNEPDVRFPEAVIRGLTHIIHDCFAG